MRILTVNYLLDPVAGGGTAERVAQITRALASTGVDSSVLTMDAGLTPQRRQDLAPAPVTALRTLNRRFSLPFPAWSTVLQRVRAADLVHIVGHWTAINLLAAAAARRCGRPVVVSPAGALRLAGRSRMLKRAYNAAGGVRMIREAAAWIAVSRNELPEYERYGVAARRVTVIPNGVDPKAFAGGDPDRFRRTLGLPGGPFVLFVGRLAWSKGPDLLLDAFGRVARRFPDHHLVMIGTDEGLQASLRATARSLGLAERVHFPGYVGGDDKAGAYHAASLLVIPSRQEAMSIVALEAGASGTPVLLTDRCGFDEVAAIGGGAVTPPTVEGLESAMAGLLSDPAGLAARGGRLRDYVRAHASWRDVAEQHRRVFASVLTTTDADAPR
ncbi:MAG: glycosyltransferase [Vicinamibacterales bacterium]